jgi:chemotaxis protein MotB
MTGGGARKGSWALLLLFSVLIPVEASALDPKLNAVLYGEGAVRFSSGFIKESLPLDGSVNQITGDTQTTGNRMLLGSGDKLFVTVNRPDELSPGDLFTVYRQRHKVFHPATGRYLGFLYNIRGVVEILKLEGTLAITRVVVSYDAISPGDGVMRFVPPALPDVTVSESEPASGTGMIVDVEPPRSLLAQRHLVYIDWGREQGLQVGNHLEVFRTGGGIPQRVVGELRVVAVEDHTASTQIVNSLAPFMKGDRFTVKEMAPEPVREAEAVSPGSQGSSTQVAKATPVPDLELQREGGRLSINLDNLVDQLEYESGEVTVKPAGLEILKQVTALLKEMPPQRITIEGHADSQPIGPSLRKQFPTNLELSKARADVVVRYLVEEGGLDPANLKALGHSDKKPIMSNTSEEGRRKNRRIEVILTPLDSGGRVQRPFEPSPEQVEPAPASPAPPAPQP